MQAVPPPTTLAVLETCAPMPLAAIFTCALITGASALGSNTALVVQVTWVAVLAEQFQPEPLTLSATGVLIVMPAGMVSVTVISALELLVPELPTVIE